MGILDRLFGGEEKRDRDRGATRSAGQDSAEGLTDEQAIERYRYMLRTAPPQAIEQAHAEAFAKLTPHQRQMALERLRDALPDYERSAAARSGDDPQALARMATRAEMRQPGTIERAFGDAGGRMGGGGFGGLMAGSFLSSLAGAVLGTMIAQQFLGHGLGGGYSAADPSADDSDAGADAHTTDAESGSDTDTVADLDSDLGGGFDVDV